MRHRFGGRHSRLLCLLAFLFSFFLVGFAKPRDPRVTAIVVPDLGGETIESAAHRHLTRRDGVVLYVAVAERKMRIETGPHARKALSDAAALRILDDKMGPLLRDGRADDAVDAGVTAIEDALAAGMTSKPPPHFVRADVALFLLLGSIGIVFIGLIAMIAFRGRAASRHRSTDAVHVPYVHVPHAPVVQVDTSSGGGFSGGGGASSSW